MKGQVLDLHTDHFRPLTWEGIIGCRLLGESIHRQDTRGTRRENEQGNARQVTAGQRRAGRAGFRTPAGSRFEHQSNILITAYILAVPQTSTRKPVSYPAAGHGRRVMFHLVCSVVDLHPSSTMKHTLAINWAEFNIRTCELSSVLLTTQRGLGVDSKQSIALPGLAKTRWHTYPPNLHHVASILLTKAQVAMEIPLREYHVHPCSRLGLRRASK